MYRLERITLEKSGKIAFLMADLKKKNSSVKNDMKIEKLKKLNEFCEMKWLVIRAMKEKIQSAWKSASLNDDLLSENVKVKQQNEKRWWVSEMRMRELNDNMAMRWFHC